LKVKVNFGGLCAVYVWTNIFAMFSRALMVRNPTVGP